MTSTQTGSDADQRREGPWILSAGMLEGPSPPPLAIKSLRKAYGMTQQEFGFLVDVDAQTVRAWEKDRSPMSFERFELVCYKLKEAPVDWINGPPAHGRRAQTDAEAEAVKDTAIDETARLRAYAVMNRPRVP